MSWITKVFSRNSESLQTHDFQYICTVKNKSGWGSRSGWGMKFSYRKYKCTKCNYLLNITLRFSNKYKITTSHRDKRSCDEIIMDKVLK